MDIATDQVTDAAAAQSLSDARRKHALAPWIIVQDQPKPRAFTARLVTRA
jgi:hypothetical protein